MAALSGDGIRHKRWGQRVLAVVLVAWLNATLQPCLMAMDSVPDPAAETAGMTHHAGAHDAHHAPVDSPCTHCPPADEMAASPCDGGVMSGCEFFPDSEHDRKDAQPTPKDGGAPAVACHGGDRDLRHTAHVFMSRPTDLPLPPAGPPLTVRFCTYLK